jgi:DNA-binding LacI/PurR family transcriptional regulator
MSTISDVAKLAKVSVSTVSRVISGKGYVSKETQKKVLQAAQELAYSPNLIARNLQSGKTQTIGFITNSPLGFPNSFLGTFIAIANLHDYYVTLYFTNGDKNKEIDVLNQMKHRQLDGIFVFNRSNEWSVFESYTAYGPIATRYRINSKQIYSSHIDHYPIYLASLNYLYQQGYKKIAHSMGNPENRNTKARIKAINSFYKGNGLLLNVDWLFCETSTENNGNQLAHWFHHATDKPEALACHSDSIAVEFISELQNLGYNVPRDVAVIGFDNSDISRLMHVTTVDYSANLQAENSFVHLYNQLNNTNIPQHHLEYKLIERKTTPKINDYIEQD